MSRDASTRIDTLEKFEVWSLQLCSNLKKLYNYPALDPIRQHLGDKITAENFWMAREKIRAYLGEYTPVCINVNFPFEHFVHVSNDNPSMVAYTANAEHGRRDRQTRLSFGRYLKKTFPTATDEHIRSIVSDYSIKYGPIELKFAETEDEIEQVYLDGPISCMKHPASNFSSPFHPVRIYAGHGIRLAYLENSAGDIFARTLVWNNKHGTIYGDQDKMKAALNIIDIHEGSLNGAKMQLIYSDGQIICPYIDEGYVDESNGCLIIRESGEYDAQSTSGFIEAPSACCSHCGDNYSADDLAYSDYYDESYCNHCLDNYYTHAIYDTHGSETSVRSDCVIEVEGTWYVDNRRILEAHCTELSSTYYEDRWTTCDTVETHAKHIILAEDAVFLYNETYAHENEDTVELHDGRMALEDDPNIVETEDGIYALLTECNKTENDSYTLLPKGTQHEATA